MNNDDIVSRADSLMRRRSFIASPAVPEIPPLPSLEAVQRPSFPPHLQPPVPEPRSPANDPDEDIPILTEEVSLEVPAAIGPRDRTDETLAARLASEFAHILESRLAAELPGLVETSLAVLEADLRRGILDTANAAIRDFQARRLQLRLPLEDADQAD